MAAAELEHDAWYQAVAAIDAGDVQRLQTLLAAQPPLVTDRLDDSPEWLRRQLGDAANGFFSRPYLLWFVAEDPVRNGRLPPNIAEMIRVIAAAARAAKAATLQEQLDSTLRLVCWSGVAAGAGLQLEMIDALVDEGAAPAKNANNALVNGHVAAAEHLLSRGGIPDAGSGTLPGTLGRSCTTQRSVHSRGSSQVLSRSRGTERQGGWRRMDSRRGCFAE